MNVNSYLELFLFTTNLERAVQAQAAGIDSIIVDWESRGKNNRQINYSTEINRDTPDDVARLANYLTIPITVRINPLGGETVEEIEIALDKGAQILMLPMATSAKEVEQFVSLVDKKAKTIVQIENQSLVDQCQSLLDIDWDFAYIGLNDLMISRRSNWIWEAVYDGTVEQIFNTLKGRKIGFGGVTIIGGGTPLPFIELLWEMARLGCHLSFLRRTFKREIVGRDLSAEIEAVRATFKAACCRSKDATLQDRDNFIKTLLKTQPAVHPHPH